MVGEVAGDGEFAPVEGGVAEAGQPSSVVTFSVTKFRPGLVTTTWASVILIGLLGCWTGPNVPAKGVPWHLPG